MMLLDSMMACSDRDRMRQENRRHGFMQFAGSAMSGSRSLPGPPRKPKSGRNRWMETTRFSRETAMGCAGSEQSQARPSRDQMPCLCWVILIAVQFQSGKARMTPQTTEVLPMFRVCPPITTTIYVLLPTSCASIVAPAPPIAPDTGGAAGRACPRRVLPRGRSSPSECRPPIR